MLVNVASDNEMVILLKSMEEKEHIINPDDPQHNHYQLPENEIWIFEKGDAPSIQKFPPVVIRSVAPTWEEYQAGDQQEDGESKKILQGPRFGLLGEELDDAMQRLVTIQLCDKLIKPEGDGVLPGKNAKETKLKDPTEWESDHKILVEPPPPTVDD